MAMRERLTFELAQVARERADLVISFERAAHVGSGRRHEEAELGLPHGPDAGEGAGADAVLRGERLDRRDDLLTGLDLQRPAVSGALGLHAASSSLVAHSEMPSRSVNSKSAATNSPARRPVSSHTRCSM